MATRDGGRKTGGGRQDQGSKATQQDKAQDKARGREPAAGTGDEEAAKGAEAETQVDPAARAEDWASKATAAATAAIEEARRRAGEAARAQAGSQAGGQSGGPRATQNAAEIAAIAFSSYQSVLAEATTFAQQMAQTTFTAWRDFAGARGPAELLEVQTRLARAQTEQVIEFTQRVTELLTRTAGQASGRTGGDDEGGRDRR